MEFEVGYDEVPESPTVTVLAAFAEGAVTDASNRIRSWAVIRGATITGAQFIRDHSDLLVTVDLPTRGRVPHPERWIAFDCAFGGPVVRVRGVPFAAIGSAIAEFSPELEAQAVVVAPREFPAGPDGFIEGDCVWRVREHPVE